MLTCLSSLALHLEVVQNVETESFIQAVRRFIARRGNIRLIRCDNGTNFVGAKSELQRSLSEMDEDIIYHISYFIYHISRRMVELIGSHGRIIFLQEVTWRCLRAPDLSARVILSALLKQHCTSLNEESLITLLTEVEPIINLRLLTVETLADIVSEAPFSPINLLTMKSKVVLPPPEGFKQTNLYSRLRWRRVQHIVEECWCRWRKEILVTL